MAKKSLFELILGGSQKNSAHRHGRKLRENCALAFSSQTFQVSCTSRFLCDLGTTRMSSYVYEYVSMPPSLRCANHSGCTVQVGEDVRVLIFKILHAILHIIRAIPSSAGPPRLFGSPPTDLRARCGVEGTFTTKEGHSSHQKSDSIPIFYTRPRPPSRQQSRPLDPLFFCSSIYLIDNHHNGESTLLIRSYSSVS